MPDRPLFQLLFHIAFVTKSLTALSTDTTSSTCENILIKKENCPFYCLSVYLAEFCEIIKETSLHKKIPFPLETSDFAKLYFGKDRVIKK